MRATMPHVLAKYAAPIHFPRASGVKRSDRPYGNDTLIWPHRDGLIWPRPRHSGVVMTV